MKRNRGSSDGSGVSSNRDKKEKKSADQNGPRLTSTSQDHTARPFPGTGDRDNSNEAKASESEHGLLLPNESNASIMTHVIHQLRNEEHQRQRQLASQSARMLHEPVSTTAIGTQSLLASLTLQQELLRGPNPFQASQSPFLLREMRGQGLLNSIGRDHCVVATARRIIATEQLIRQNLLIHQIHHDEAHSLVDQRTLQTLRNVSQGATHSVELVQPIDAQSIHSLLRAIVRTSHSTPLAASSPGPLTNLPSSSLVAMHGTPRSRVQNHISMDSLIELLPLAQQLLLRQQEGRRTTRPLILPDEQEPSAAVPEHVVFGSSFGGIVLGQSSSTNPPDHDLAARLQSYSQADLRFPQQVPNAPLAASLPVDRGGPPSSNVVAFTPRRSSVATSEENTPLPSVHNESRLRLWRATKQQLIEVYHTPLTVATDEENLNQYQCLVRQQIFLFEAGPDDLECNAQGRNRPIVLKQVGIICKYCFALSPSRRRARGTVYFPARLDGLYQAAQNMATNHFAENCVLIPADTRTSIIAAKDKKRKPAGGSGAGKSYWVNAALILGVVRREGSNGLVRT